MWLIKNKKTGLKLKNTKFEKWLLFCKVNNIICQKNCQT